MTRELRRTSVGFGWIQRADRPRGERVVAAPRVGRNFGVRRRADEVVGERVRAALATRRLAHDVALDQLVERVEQHAAAS